MKCTTSRDVRKVSLHLNHFLSISVHIPVSACKIDDCVQTFSLPDSGVKVQGVRPKSGAKLDQASIQKLQMLLLFTHVRFNSSLMIAHLQCSVTCSAHDQERSCQLLVRLFNHGFVEEFVRPFIGFSFLSLEPSAKKLNHYRCNQE